MTYMQDIENQEHLKALVLQDLKECGIKIPKTKKNKTRDDSLELGRNIFGNHLCLLPCVYVDSCGPVPKFLVEASKLLEKHADTEGLFRKSGSVARQKELKQKIEEGQELNGANPLDLASLMKQFFRELPDPLLTSRYHDTFIRAFSMDPEERRICAMLMLCLLLPWHHLCVLRFMMSFLNRISMHCDVNKMDVQNLSVCLAPNLLYSAIKPDKLHLCENKLLQIQTNIVHMLIVNADNIGMVSKSLLDRVKLMESCFPSEDELDRSDNAQNDSKSSKKKKKRSASFQGIMSNLSSSFSKWRKEGRHHHNASNVSEKSTYSFTSMADKSSVLIPDHPDSVAYLEALGYPPELMTPKIRKRKAEDDGVPFSESKKQAILQSMPHMSALGGTPFTPATVKRGAKPSEFYDTPSIKFSEGVSADTLFAATPKYRMDRNLSTPITGVKQRKSPTHNGGKAGCFSPKTPRHSVRRTMRGFLKRLSGGKDHQGELGSATCVTVIEPSSSTKRRSFFGKHRKTPSSPARLITPGGLRIKRSGSNLQDNVPRIILPSNCDNPDRDPLARKLETDDKAEEMEASHHKRRYSADGTTPLGQVLKRGKPNTLRTGLPSPSHRRSIDNKDNLPPGMNESESAARHRFLSPDKYGNNPVSVDCVASTLDTSPILKSGEESGAMVGNMEVTGLSDMMASQTHEQLSRQISGTSVVSLSIVEQTQMESDHDRAFIHESMLLESEPESSSEEEEELDDEEEEELEDEEEELEDEEAELDEEEMMEASDGSYIGEDMLEEASKYRGDGGKVEGCGQKQHTNSVESLDSAISDCPPNHHPEDRNSSAVKSSYASLHSVKSFDSGLSMSDPNNPKMSSSLSLANNEDSRSNNKDTKTESLNCSVTSTTTGVLEEENSSSVLIQRHPSIRRKAKDPKLRISQDMHQMLNRVGASVSESDENNLGENDVYSTPTTELNACPVDSDSVEKAKEEIAERKASPYRFPNSVCRKRGGVSPVRIPTIFAKADKEASKYRDIAKAAIRQSPGPKRPFLPLSTNLVNASSVMEVKSRLDNNTSNAGHTPCRLLTDNSLHSTEITDADSTPQAPPMVVGAATPQIRAGLLPATPQIRSGLLPARGLVSVRECNNISSNRTPVKPIKRLQGTTPLAGFSRSPKKVIGVVNRPAGRMSPIPSSGGEWTM